jgi:GTP pyrophosphokinase
MATPAVWPALEQKLVDHYRSRFHPEAWHRVERALELARASHRGQTRAEGTPYVIHPIRTALILAVEVGVQNPELLSAALLHDVLEDTVMTADVMRLFVGDRVTGWVLALTKPSDAEGKKRYLERIAAADEEVRLIKCADRLDNVRGLHLVEDADRRRRYYDETRLRVLPLAERTHPYLAAELRAFCERFAAEPA